jgi:hypothetical protein
MLLAHVHVLTFALLGSVHTVDDDQPASFASITAAIAASQPGDVLIVEPGTYGPFTLSHSLTILGRAGGPLPQVTGRSTLEALDGFTVAGLAFAELDVVAVAGHGRIDRCEIGVFAAPADLVTLDVAACDQLEVSRVTVHGLDGEQAASDGGTAMRITASRAALTAATLLGGKGQSSYPAHGLGDDGGHGLWVTDGSRVTVAGCPQIRGGAAGEGYAGIAHVLWDGIAGDGIRASDSKIWLRGAPTDVVSGGNFDPFWGGDPGFGAKLEQATFVTSGVSLESGCFTCGLPPIDASSTILIEPAQEPWLLALGQDGPGQTRDVVIHAPAGAPGLLFGSLATGSVTVAGLGAQLWLGLPIPIAVPFVATGTLAPLSIPVVMPPAAGLEGVVLGLQAVFPSIPDPQAVNEAFVSNPANLVVRP